MNNDTTMMARGGFVLPTRLDKVVGKPHARHPLSYAMVATNGGDEGMAFATNGHALAATRIYNVSDNWPKNAEVLIDGKALPRTKTRRGVSVAVDANGNVAASFDKDGQPLDGPGTDSTFPPIQDVIPGPDKLDGDAISVSINRLIECLQAIHDGSENPHVYIMKQPGRTNRPLVLSASDSFAVLMPMTEKGGDAIERYTAQLGRVDEVLNNTRGSE
jgi:hypothetical protein